MQDFSSFCRIIFLRELGLQGNFSTPPPFPQISNGSYASSPTNYNLKSRLIQNTALTSNSVYCLRELKRISKVLFCTHFTDYQVLICLLFQRHHSSACAVSFCWWEENAVDSTRSNSTRSDSTRHNLTAAMSTRLNGSHFVTPPVRFIVSCRVKSTIFYTIIGCASESDYVIFRLAISGFTCITT